MNASNVGVSRRPTHNGPRTALLITVLIAMLLIPAASLVLSFKAYRPMGGLWGSAWVGFDNYARVLAAPKIWSVAGNSLELWLIQHLGGLALGLPVALAIAHIRRRNIALALGSLMLLPMAVPELSWFIAVKALLPEGALTNPDLYQWVYLLQTIAPTAALVAFSGAAFAIISGRPAGAWKGIGIVALVWALAALSPNVRAISLSYNPNTYAASDVLSTYVFRTGLLHTEFGTAAAASCLRAAAQLVIAILPALLIARIARTDSAARSGVETGGGWRLANMMVVVALGIALVVALAQLPGALPALNAGWLMELPGIVGVSETSAIAAAVFGLALAVVVFYALDGTRGWGLAAIGLALLSLSGHTVAEYLQFLDLGLMNTPWCAALLSAFKPENLMLLMVLGAASMSVRSGKKKLALAAVVGLLAASVAMGDYWNSMLYVMDRSSYNLGLALRQSIFEGGANPAAQSALHLVTLGGCMVFCSAAVGLCVYGMKE